MRLQFSFNEAYAPGRELRERFAAIRAAGVECVEVDPRSVRADGGRSAQAAAAAEGLRVGSICGGIQGCLLSDEPKVRQIALDDLKRLLEAGGSLGAKGIVLAPIIGPPRLPDLRPWLTPQEVHEGLLVALLSEIAPVAEAARCQIWLEPLNRYRTHFLQTFEAAVAICEKVGSDWVHAMIDTFHAALEETDVIAAVRGARGRLRHVHAVDTNRRLPGHGGYDFGTFLEALAEIGYDGQLAFEAPVEGDFGMSVRRAMDYVKDSWEKR